MSQHRQPGHLPTPGKEIHQLTAHVQGNWDHLFDRLKQQEKAVRELTQESAKTISLHDAKLATLAAKMETNHQQILDTIAAQKQDEEGSSDQLIKAMKVMVTGELQKSESTFISEVRFMVEQVQLELQKDIQVTQENSRKDCEQLSKEISHCTTQLYALGNDFKDLQLEMSNYFKSLKKAVVDQPLPAHHTGPSSSPPSEAASIQQIQQPTPAVKSDHLKLTFPMFGRPSDGADPLLYLTRCQDFLALHPLADADILATFRTVLYGTARNWWEVARSSVTTWNDFETAFLSAFLSEDYEDELAERVRTRTQGEKESIRDFAFTYRALCRRWKPTLTENG